MPTVEADVAFGLGKFHLISDEVKSRVSIALDVVGMLKYSQVCFRNKINQVVYFLGKIKKKLFLLFTETNSDSQWRSEAKSCYCRCSSWSMQSTTIGWADNIFGWVWPGSCLIYPLSNQFYFFLLVWCLSFF